MPVRKDPFPVHGYEVDAFGTLAAPALSGFLSEIAGLHAVDLGVGLDALKAKGLTWVLLRLRLENPVPVRLGETVEIETWPSGVERLFALRDFVVRRGDGTEVARASSQWLVLDVETRKPVRPGDVLDPRLPREPLVPVVALSKGKLPELREWELQKRFHVRYADIDHNLHVTNTSYLAWAVEAVPRDLWQSARLAAFEVQYVAECTYGTAVLSRLVRTGPNAYAHAVVREEDGKELARLVTAWAPR